MKLLFMDRHDVHRPWGHVRFRPTPFRYLGKTEMRDIICFAAPRPDGTADVFHYQMSRHVPWKLLRSVTADGIRFEDTHLVCERAEYKWHYAARMMYSPELERYIFMKNAIHDGEMQMYIFHSRDGESWEEHPGGPVFADGDAWGAMWSPSVQRFIYYGKGWQRWDKGGVHDLVLNGRRVVTIRTSQDGFRWTPDTASQYFEKPEYHNNMRLLRGRLVPIEFQISPDDEDPPDLEFYSANAFAYAGRYYLHVNNYAGSFIQPGIDPMRANGHGVFLPCERWISRDGLNWSRPFREIDAGAFSLHNPMLVNGMMLFQRGDRLHGLPADRLTYATSTTNSRFETEEFPMPAGPLRLNVKIPGDEYDNQENQAYVMAELIDDRDRVIPGYERDGCLLQAPLDRPDHPLLWHSDGRRREGSELAGSLVRVRFYARASAIYALTG